MHSIRSLFRYYIRGVHLGNLESWGEKKAYFFTELNLGMFLSLLVAPVCVVISLYVFRTVYPVVVLIPFSVYIIEYFHKNKLLKDLPLEYDFNSDEIRKLKRISDLVFYIVMVISIYLSWQSIFYLVERT